MNNKNSILIFWENDEDFILMFSLFLQEHGYFTESVKSFDECVEFCKNKPPTLLIIQSRIHELKDGLIYVRKIRLNSDISYFPIIMGWADFAYKTEQQGYQEAFEAGANACFGRVFDITDVLEEIQILSDNPKATNIVDRQTIRIEEIRRNNKK